MLAQGPADALARIRMLEAKGEELHNHSDIGAAQRLWAEALDFRKQVYGDSSAEAAVGYAYEARYHNFMAGSSADHRALAWSMARRAKRLLRRSALINVGEHVLVLREFAYAFKIINIHGPPPDSLCLRQCRAYFREALAVAGCAHDTLRMAQVTHDIGNTYTDQVGRYNQVIPRLRLQALVDSARACYGRSSALLIAAGRPTSESVVMDHLCMGILYKDAYAGDSAVQAIDAFDHALSIMLQRAGRPPNSDPLSYEPRITNKAQMVELLYLRSWCFVPPYTENPDPERLRRALQSLEAAVPYWTAMLREYRSHDIHKVIASFSHFPFNYGTYLAAELYMLTGDEQRLKQALRWSDLNRDGLEQRDRLRNGTSSVRPADPAVILPENTLPHGKVCISFHTYPRALAFVVDDQGARVVRLERASEEPYPFARVTRDLHEAMRLNDMASFKRIAHEMHRRLLAPILDHGSYEEAIIVPAGSMERIPFEALIQDSAKGAGWEELDYVLQHATIRYARTIEEALRSAEAFAMADGHWALARARGSSQLPFAQALVDRMGSNTRFADCVALDLTGARLKALMRKNGWLHIASHAEAPREPDALPFIALEDGPFTIGAIDSTGCASSLVVLSACSSGDGQVFIGEGGHSLGRAFLRNGARLVVQTCWPVDDQATSEVLAGMYEGMDQGQTVSQALHEAKLAYLRKHADGPLANPFYWGGIIATGVDQQPAQVGGLTWWPVGAVAVLMAGAVIYRRSRRRRARVES